MTVLATDNLALLSGAPDGIAQLRALVLDLATHGRLCPQLAEEEPAEALLAEVLPNARLSTKARRGRVAADVDPEAPEAFPLPAGWRWAKVGDIADVVRGVTYSKGDASEAPGPGLVPLLRGNNINGSLNFEKLVYVPSELVSADQRVKVGDLVVAMSSGSADLVGKAALAVDDFPGGFGAFCGVVRSRSSALLPYLAFFFRTPFYRASAAGKGKGIGINNLQKSALQALPIPIPPLAEQHRIVAEVDELMALCDRLEARQQDAEAAHARLVQAMLDSLTQARDAEEFQACWQRLARQFQISFTTVEAVDKLKQVIRDVAVSGRLLAGSAGEASWEWSTLGAEVTGMDSGWSPACLDAPSSSEEAWGVLRTTAVQSLQYVQAENKALPSHLEPRPEAEVRAGDILFTRAGPMNRVAISCLVEATRPRLMLSDKIIRFRPKARVLGGFMALCLNAGKTAAYLEQAKSGMAASQVNISQAKLKAAPIPVPPLDEQGRIVSAVAELLALCDRLRARVTAVRRKHAELAEALVMQAVD